MQESKEQRADRHRIQNAIFLILRAQNAPENKLLAEGGQNTIGQNQTHGRSRRAVVGGGEGVIQSEGGLRIQHPAYHGKQGTTGGKQQNRRQDNQDMRQRHAPQTQGRHKLLPAQADIQVCRDREYQQLEKNRTQVFPLPRQECPVNQAGKQKQRINHQHQPCGTRRNGILAAQKRLEPEPLLRSSGAVSGRNRLVLHERAQASLRKVHIAPEHRASGAAGRAQGNTHTSRRL